MPPMARDSDEAASEDDIGSHVGRRPSTTGRPSGERLPGRGASGRLRVVFSGTMKGRPGRHQRGFTLVELMVVVVIVGILASLGIVALYRYQRDAKHVEGLAVIYAIASAEDRYRAENMVYLDVSTDFATLYPRPTPSSVKTTWRQTSHTDLVNWQRLAVPYAGLVQYGYAVKAWLPAATFTPPTGINATIAAGLTWPTTVTEPYYVIQAEGDLDGDGVRSVLFKSSFNETIVQHNEGE